MRSFLKGTWISPFIAVSFCIISMTGILMLLHVRNGALSVLHEWMGVIFVVAGFLHLILNWSAFLSCFKNKQSVITVVVVLLVSSILFFGGIFGDKGYSDFSGRKGYPRIHHR